MKFLLSLFFLLLNTICFSQSKMTPREAFFYGLNVTDQSAGTSRSYQGFSGGGKTYQWGDFYASYFDKENYIKAVNDEFKRVPYLTQKFKELNEGIQNVDFNKTFSSFVTIGFGTYNTDCSCFPLYEKELLNFKPLLLDIKEVGNDKLTFGNSFTELRIENFANFNDFDFVFKIKSSEAEKLIDSKKDNSGKISRNISLKIIYNITKKAVGGITAYIQKIEFYNGPSIVGTLSPKHDFYDKVNMIRIRDGVDTAYYISGGTRTFELSEAGTYRVVNYKEGKAVGKVKSFYMSGKLNMECYYNDKSTDFHFDGPITWYYESGGTYCIENFVDDVPNGKYTLWHENSQKKEEGNYNKGKLDGKFIAWHENGFKSEEVTYIDGVKNGCYFTWNKDGKCTGNVHPFGGVVDGEFYENGSALYYNQSKCPCKDQKTNADNSSSNNSNNNESNTNQELNSDGKTKNTILISELTNNQANDFAAKNISFKSSSNSENVDALFLSSYKFLDVELSDNYKQYVKNWFKDIVDTKITGSNIDLTSLTKDSITKFDFVFTVRFAGSASALDAYVNTQILITKNGRKIEETSFEKSSDVLLLSDDVKKVLNSSMTNSWKKVKKFLSKYIQIE